MRCGCAAASASGLVPGAFDTDCFFKRHFFIWRVRIPFWSLAYSNDGVAVSNASAALAARPAAAAASRPTNI